MSESNGANLRAARDFTGYSRSYVVRRLDPPVTEKTLERWEKGVSPVRRYRLVELAELYGVDVDSLVDDVVAA